jgi:hypothetical protein
MSVSSDHSRELLAFAIAQGKQIKDAASEADLSASRAYVIAREESFRQRVSEIRQTVLDGAVGKLNDAIGKAVDTLVAVLDADSERDRVAAAKAIIAALAPVSELGELRARLDRLEGATISRRTA